MAKASKSRFAILGILAGAPGSSGYDIQSLMKASTNFFWKETFSSIYPVLDSLEKERLINAFEDPHSGRKRKTYKITKKGLNALQSWLMEDVELEQARNELLLKIFFGGFNSISSSIKHVENYKQQISEKIHVVEQAKKTLPKEYPGDPGLPFWLLAVEFGLRRLQASIEWSDHALKKLKQLNQS